jgi:hypothetical protein
LAIEDQGAVIRPPPVVFCQSSFFAKARFPAKALSVLIESEPDFSFLF